MTPFDTVAQLMRSDPGLLFQPEDMLLTPPRYAVQCRATGILHHHDFDHDEHHDVIEDAIPDQLQNLRGKVSALWRRLDDACHDRSKVLFVRSWCAVLHYPATSPKQALGGESFKFHDFLAAIHERYPDLDFHVMFMNYGLHQIDDSCASFINLEYPDGSGVMGWDPSWDAAFAHVALASQQNAT